jgi:hypothetical protein
MTVMTPMDDNKTYIRVMFTHHTEYTSHMNNGVIEETGDNHTTYQVYGLEISEAPEQLSLPGDVKPGDILHLVYAVYSTGDSMGTSYNSSIDFISVHRLKHRAEMNADELEKTADDETTSSIHIILDEGTRIPYRFPWLNYFDSLSYIEIGTFKVRSSGKS